MLGSWVSPCSGIPHTYLGILPTLPTPAEKIHPLFKHFSLPLQLFSFAQAREAFSFSWKLELLIFIFPAFFWALVLETQKPKETPLSLLLVNTPFP